MSAMTPNPKKKPSKRSKLSTSITPRLFDESKLHPYTVQRDVVATRDMGFTFKYSNHRSPGEALWDVIVFLWLRSIPNDKVDEAERNPWKARKAAMAWAEARKIRTGSPALFEGHTIMVKTINEIAAARGTPVIPADAEREEVEGES